jgi:hypothetical protein
MQKSLSSGIDAPESKRLNRFNFKEGIEFSSLNYALTMNRLLGFIKGARLIQTNKVEWSLRERRCESESLRTSTWWAFIRLAISGCESQIAGRS